MAPMKTTLTPPLKTTSGVALLSGVAFRGTPTENRPPAPAPVEPGRRDQPIGWTAWSG